MNTKEMECFLSVCKNKSINKAAKEMFITVQGLSRIIKKLEEELGTEVIYRTTVIIIFAFIFGFISVF